jgi:hypothetical protein
MEDEELGSGAGASQANLYDLNLLTWAANQDAPQEPKSQGLLGTSDRGQSCRPLLAVRAIEQRTLAELSRFGWDSGLKPVPEAAEVSLNQ